MDYHEWTPQSPPSRDPRAARPPYGDGAGSNVEPGRSEPGRSEPGRAAPTVSGQFRPRYSDRDYADHGYWGNDQQRDRREPTPTSLARLNEQADHTGSWRLGQTSTNRAEVALPGRDAFDDDRDYPAVLWWTGIWYAAPILLYGLLALVASSSTMRPHALHAFVGDAFAVVFALALSLGVAAGTRRTTLAWRAITVGFGAAVVGAGIATLLVTAF